MSGIGRWGRSSSVQWLYVESEYDIHPVTMHSRQGVKRKSYLHLCFVYLKHRDPKRPGLLIATHDAKKHDIKSFSFPFFLSYAKPTTLLHRRTNSDHRASRLPLVRWTASLFSCARRRRYFMHSPVVPQTRYL